MFGTFWFGQPYFAQGTGEGEIVSPNAAEARCYFVVDSVLREFVIGSVQREFVVESVEREFKVPPC